MSHTRHKEAVKTQGWWSRCFTDRITTPQKDWESNTEQASTIWNNKFYYKVASCWYFYWVILRCTDPWISNIKHITHKNKLYFLSVRVVFDSQFLTSVSFHLHSLQMNKLGTILQHIVYISVSMIQKPSKLRFRKYAQKTFTLCSVVPRIDREMCIPCCKY
jgi:hypothetical protein